MISPGFDYKRAMEEIDALMERGVEPGTPEADRLDELVTDADEYERERYPTRPVDPVAAILFRMEQEGAE